jgi:PII-like signaling protein
MATGSQLTLYASRNLKHGHRSAIDWILEVAKAAGVHGATVMDCSQGVDAQGRVHAARFFELADEPAVVVVVAEDATIDALLATLGQGGIPLFYTRTPLEFGHIGAP